MEKKISVIVPCYNVEKYINRCMNSLVHQTIGIESLELILVDDASKDKTLGHLFRWEKRFQDSIVVVSCNQNGRQGRARNIGMEYVSTPYIFFLDSDDWIELDTLEKLYHIAVSTEVEIVIAQMGRDAGHGFLMDEFHFAGEYDKIVFVREDERKCFFENGMEGCKLYRTDFLREHNLCFLEGTAYEDNYFGALVIAYISSYYALKEKHYHYFANLASTVTSRNSLKHLERLEVEKLTLDRLCELGYDKIYYDEIYGRFLRLYYLNTLHLIFQRFDSLPYSVLEEMRSEILMRIPNYKTSTFYQKLTELEKGFLLTLEVEMTEELWDNLASNYRYIVKNNSKNKCFKL